MSHYLPGLSYGAAVPSLAMQRSMRIQARPIRQRDVDEEFEKAIRYEQAGRITDAERALCTALRFERALS